MTNARITRNRLGERRCGTNGEKGTVEERRFVTIRGDGQYVRAEGTQGRNSVIGQSDHDAATPGHIERNRQPWSPGHDQV